MSAGLRGMCWFLAVLLLAAASGVARAELPIGATDADTSADGRFVVYLREVPGRFLPAPSGDSLAVSELWFAHLDGAQPRVLLTAGDRRHRNGSPMAGFGSPRFSPDGRRVYFTSAATVTSDVVVACDLASGVTREVCAANSLRVVRRGPRAGQLIVEQHRYRKGGGSYDWLYVVSPAGRTLLTLGDPEDAAVKARVAALLAR